MLQLHTDFNPMTAMHWKQCCERAALYKTVGKYYSDQAMAWIDEMTEEYARKGGEFLNLLLKVPGMARLFLPVSGGAWLSGAESRILQKR